MHRVPGAVPLDGITESPAALMRVIAVLLVLVAIVTALFPYVGTTSTIHELEAASMTTTTGPRVSAATAVPPAHAHPSSDRASSSSTSSSSASPPPHPTPSESQHSSDSAAHASRHATSASAPEVPVTMSTPIDQLTNAQIKEELRTLYATTDFSDCFEPGDLQRKLQATRDSTPITHGLRYGPLLEIGNKKNPTGVVTISHGLGDSAHGWEDVGYELARRLPYLLFLLPTAPSRPVTINGGMSIPAWYDITGTLGDGVLSARQDATGLRQSADYVRSLAHITTKRHGIAPHRVVYGGFSQGAAVSLCTGLTAHIAPAGIACMSGYLAAYTDVLPRISQKSVPITMFHGRQDPVVPITAAKESKNLLEKEGGVAPITFLEYNMQHSAVPQEVNDVEAFIARVLPEKF